MADEAPPAPPPPPPPPAGVKPVEDVDSLVKDTEEATKKDDQDTKKVDENSEATDANKESDEEPIEPIGDEFKQRKDRGCTDILCCVMLVCFVLVWAVLAYVAFTYGKPYSIIYGTDYEGNYCGHSCSTDAPASSNCTASTILKKKYAHFPRITSDLMAQASSIAKGQIPTFYTLCVETCPKQWDIKCSYDFEASNPNWKTSIAEFNQVKSCLGATSMFTKYMVSLAPDLLTATLQSKELSGDITSADYCGSVFSECDVTGVGTEMILNRCIPTETSAPANITERCISPLSTTACNETGTFNVDCVADPDTGSYFTTLYKPTYTYGEGYFNAKLTGDAKSSCVTKQTYTENLTEELASSDQLSFLIDALKSFSALFADIITAWQAIVVAGFVCCMIISWGYVGLLRFCAPLLVWGSCILLELIFILLGPWLLVRGGVIDINALMGTASSSLSPSASAEANAGVAQVTSNSLMNEAEEAEKQYYIWAGYAACVFAFVWLCCLIFLRKAIKMAIKIIQISTMAMGSMPELVLFPLVTYGGIVILAIVWLIIGTMLQTAGTISSTSLLNETASATAAANSAAASTSNSNITSIDIQSSYAQVEEMDVINYLWLYHIFMGLWVNAFIQGVAMLTIAGSVSKWYFTPSKSMKKHQGCCPVCKSYCITCRFHLGTVAFGSFIIAVVQTVRLIVGYIQKKMDEAGESKIKKVIMCIVQCCLWCLEKCMKFISKNAYIYTSLSGTSFCYSAFKSFFLILNNLAGFGMTSSITMFLLLIGKLATVCTSIYLCYLYLTYDATLANTITSEIMPMVATGLIAYVVSDSFFDIVGNVMDSKLYIHS
jgi:hypothetical protein